MTTIMSMTGKDPETGETFVLKAADTLQRTKYSNVHEVFDDISSKIVLPARTQYAFSRCGNNECANESAKMVKSRPEKYIELQKSYMRIADACDGTNTEIKGMILEGLTNGHVKEIEEMNRIQKRIDDERSTSFIFTTYKGDIAVYDVSSKGVAKRSCRVFKGTGGDHAREVVKANIRCSDEEVGSFTIEDALCIAMRAMEISNKNDKCTGGHMDVAILTSTGARHFRHMKKLNENMNEAYIQNLVREKLDRGSQIGEEEHDFSKYLEFLRGEEQYDTVKKMLDDHNPKSLANALNYIENEYYDCVIDALIETDSLNHLERALGNKTIPEIYREKIKNYLCEKFNQFDALFDPKTMKIIKFY